MTTATRHSPWRNRLALPPLVCILALGLVGPATGAESAQGRGQVGRGTPHVSSWVGTWGTVPTGVPPTGGSMVEDQTIRQIVHTSIGGDTLQVRLSNEFGDQPLLIGEAHVALRAAGETATAIVPESDRRLTFSGRSSVTIPVGAPILSDPVPLRVPALSDLVVSIYLPGPTPTTTVHAFSFQRSYVASGNVTGATTVDPTSTPTQWYFLTGVAVRTRLRDAASIVALGDSITDGANTTVNANRRWPDFLARRLQATRRLDHLGVVNEGISGNRLLHDPNPPPGDPAEGFAAYFGPSALRRFDRDVLAQPGVRHVIALIGVNDLGHPGTVAPVSETVSADDIVAGYRQLIARAHQHGLNIYGGTITPFKGDTFGFYSEENEASRQAVNDWIRTSGEFDAVIDFDAALRDPADEERLLPRYDSGDHLHPNDAGMRAMACAVPLQLFSPGLGRTRSADPPRDPSGRTACETALEVAG